MKNKVENRYSLSPLKLVLALSVVIVSLTALAQASPDLTPGAYGFAASNISVALTTPDWRRRMKGRCLVKTTASLGLLVALLVVVWSLPTVPASAIGLLCIAAALLSLVPAVPYLAKRS